MTTCERCKTTYPAELVSPMLGSQYVNLCGICALDVTNEIHGTQMQQFGEDSEAEWMRLEALYWRKYGRRIGP